LICNLQNKFGKRKRISQLEIGFGPNSAWPSRSQRARGLRSPDGRRHAPADSQARTV
jgi:hypothetical protein